jgi:hypothetical protein
MLVTRVSKALPSFYYTYEAQVKLFIRISSSGHSNNHPLVHAVYRPVHAIFFSLNTLYSLFSMRYIARTSQ